MSKAAIAALPQGTPATGRDSIAMRAVNARFRGIGNPFAFLAEIGLVPIKEFLFRGATIIDLADELNLPVTTIRTWIEENGYQGELEDAGVLSAEGYIRQGELMLKAAANKFELDKAKAMIEHGRWMATKKDKKTYGQTQAETGQQAAVSYTFLIGDNAAVQINQSNSGPKIAPEKPLEPGPEKPKPVEFSLEQINPFMLERPPEYLQKVHSDYPIIAPIPEPQA